MQCSPIQSNQNVSTTRRGVAPAVSSRIEARLVGYAALLALALLGAGAAQASQINDFTGPYDVANWTTTYITVGGSVDTSGAPTSITVVSPDSGGGFNQIDFTIAAVADGLWSFDWSYDSVDFPGNDEAGWLLNGTFNFLANSSGDSSSVVPISVMAGDIIGFRAYATDSGFGPGFLTVSNFSAPVPEPAILSLFALGAAGVAVARRRRTHSADKAN